MEARVMSDRSNGLVDDGGPFQRARGTMPGDEVALSQRGKEA